MNILPRTLLIKPLSILIPYLDFCSYLPWNTLKAMSKRNSESSWNVIKSKRSALTMLDSIWSNFLEGKGLNSIKWMQQSCLSWMAKLLNTSQITNSFSSKKCIDKQLPSSTASTKTARIHPIVHSLSDPSLIYSTKTTTRINTNDWCATYINKRKTRYSKFKKSGFKSNKD